MTLLPTTFVAPEWLIDGTGAHALTGGGVLVRDGLITQVYETRPPSAGLPPRCNVLELPGATLLPGLIDSHVHLCLPGDGTPFTETVAQPRQIVAAVAARNARTALRSGITTLRDCGGFPDVLFPLRQAIQLGSELGPRLVLAGSPLTVKRGHCYYFGGEASGVNELRSKVRECIALGADYVKIMGSGGGTPGTISWMPSFNQDEMLALVEEAHRLHRKAVVHSLCAESIEYAVATGADEIEHANFLTGPDTPQAFDPHVAEKMAGKKVPVCPTLSVGRFVLEAKEDVKRWKTMLDENLANAAAMHRLGVQFVAGTDAGWRWSPFNALQAEMELMVGVGLSSMECIIAATSKAAATLGLEEVVGAIRPGLAADLVAVQGRPDQDLRTLTKIVMVMKDGRVSS